MYAYTMHIVHIYIYIYIYKYISLVSQYVPVSIGSIVPSCISSGIHHYCGLVDL